MTLLSKSSLFKITCFTALLIITTLFFALPSNAAQTTDTSIKNITLTPAFANLKDNNVNTSSAVDSIKLSGDSFIDSIYIVFWSEAVNYKITYGDKELQVSNTFLHSYTKLPEDAVECKELTVTFEKKINVSDIYAFTEGELPDWVQIWNQPWDKADILLNSTHADDEHLFFAGILPYHVAKGYRVQVVYFTDHTNNLSRRHELLNGLWTVGVDHYPVISKFPDAYSTTSAAALNNFKWAGFTEDNIISFQVEMLRRFKPQVVVSHDLKGEYNHGQHILNAETLIKAVDLASDAANYPDSANAYGIWNTPKLYLHLYTENSITLNWDEPLEYFGGKSAFQVSQDGYNTHKSQHYTWFTAWLKGNNGNITQATQINTYSPCNYGLYRTTVGEDVEKNSFFENIISYDEQERLEQERLEQERLEQEEQKRREEEESRRLEEESKRLESEAESSRIAESERAELEKQKEIAEAQKNDSQTKGLIAVIILVTSVIILVILLIKKAKR